MRAVWKRSGSVATCRRADNGSSALPRSRMLEHPLKRRTPSRNRARGRLPDHLEGARAVLKGAVLERVPSPRPPARPIDEETMLERPWRATKSRDGARRAPLEGDQLEACSREVPLERRARELLHGCEERICADAEKLAATLDVGSQPAGLPSPLGSILGSWLAAPPTRRQTPAQQGGLLRARRLRRAGVLLGGVRIGPRLGVVILLGGLALLSCVPHANGACWNASNSDPCFSAVWVEWA